MPDGYHSPLVDVHNVPGGLEVSDVGVGQQGVLLVGVEQGEVLHDDGHQQVQYDIGDDHVETGWDKIEKYVSKCYLGPVCSEYRGLLQLHYSVLLRSVVEFWNTGVLKLHGLK